MCIVICFNDRLGRLEKQQDLDLLSVLLLINYLVLFRFIVCIVICFNDRLGRLEKQQDLDLPYVYGSLRDQ